MLRITLALWIICMVAPVVDAETITERHVVKELKNDFFTIRKDKKSAMPLMSNQKTKKAYLILDPKKIRNNYLSFESTNGLTLYLNNKLVFKDNNSGLVHLKLSEYEEFSSGDFVFVFHSPQSFIDKKKVSLTKLVVKEAVDSFTLIDRHGKNKNIVTVFLILIVALIAFIKNTNAIIWAGYFDIRRVFFEKLNKAEYVPKSVFAQESVLLILLVSLLGGVLFHQYGLDFFLSGYNSILKAVYYVLMVLSFLVVKFFVLRIITWFLNISSFGNRQFYDFLRFLLWYTIGLLLFSLSFGNNFSILIDGFFWLGIVFWNVKIFLGAVTQLKFQKLYLFSYICASELMPALALVNFIDTIH